MTTDQSFVPQGVSSLAQVRRDRARKRLLAFSLFVALPTALSALYSGVLASREYTSVAEIAIDTEDGGPPGPNRPVPGTDIGRDTLLIQEFIRSRDVLDTLVTRHGFVDHFANDRIDRFSRLRHGASREEMHAYYLEHISVDFDTDTSFLKLEVRAYSGAYAKELATAILAAAESRLGELTASMRAERTRDVAALVTDAERRLTTAQTAVLAEERSTAPDAAKLDRLRADRDVAMEAYRAAGASLERARSEAAERRQHFLRITGPSRPDRASGPTVWRDVLTMAFVSMALLVIAAILVETAREHADF